MPVVAIIMAHGEGHLWIKWKWRGGGRRGINTPESYKPLLIRLIKAAKL